METHKGPKPSKSATEQRSLRTASIASRYFGNALHRADLPVAPKIGFCGVREIRA